MTNLKVVILGIVMFGLGLYLGLGSNTKTFNNGWNQGVDAVKANPVYCQKPWKKKGFKHKGIDNESIRKAKEAEQREAEQKAYQVEKSI